MTDNDNTRPRKKRLGEYLVVSRGAINRAVEEQINDFVLGKPVNMLGETLIKNGIITLQELDSSLRQQRMERLASCPVFSTMTLTELAAISKNFVEVSVAPGEQFVTQGEEDPTLYVIASGEVEVFQIDNSGKEIHIARVKEGEPIGEMGYFTGERRTASVRAVTPTQLLRADYKDLTHYFQSVPRVALAFTRVVKARQSELERIASNS